MRISGVSAADICVDHTHVFNTGDRGYIGNNCFALGYGLDELRLKAMLVADEMLSAFTSLICALDWLSLRCDSECMTLRSIVDISVDCLTKSTTHTHLGGPRQSPQQ